MRVLDGLTKYKVQGLQLAMVHKKNNSHSMFIRPHKPHVLPFLSYLSKMHNSLKEEKSEMWDYQIHLTNIQTVK